MPQTETDSAFVDSLLGQTIAGRYVVERVLRSGGMGVVALGRHPALQQEVAIKFMKPEFAAYPVLCERFLREARLAARVKSPHFVRVYDYGRVDPGVPYLVMEMLTGRDLADEMDEVGAVPIATAVDYVLQASVALAEVHALGIIHRDLKPSNLFLAEAGGTRMLKVLDFGISKEKLAESLTQTGASLGTPRYMSPEQVREARSVDARSDIWALGVVLYELLTGEVPFGANGETNGEIFGLILHTDPPPPRQHASTLPEALEDVVLQCLRREPQERFPSVLELADALRSYAAPESRARVDAIHKIASSGLRPISGSDVASGDEPTVPSDAGARAPRPATPRSNAPTAALAPTTPSPLAEPPQPTGLTAAGTPQLPPHGVARRLVPQVAAVALLSGVGVGALVMMRSPAPAAPPTVSAAIPTSAPAAPPPSIVSSAPPTSTAVASTPVPPAPSAARPSASAARSARPAARASAARAPSAPPSNLLDDRK